MKYIKIAQKNKSKNNKVANILKDTRHITQSMKGKL